MIETTDGAQASVARSIRGVVLELEGRPAEFSPAAARELGRELIRRAGTHKRLPGSLWGLAEIAVAFDVTKQAVIGWRELEGFPPPLAKLAGGPVWDADAVRAWWRRRTHTKDGKQSTSGRRR